MKLGTPNACTGCHLEPKNVDENLRGKLNEYADWQQLRESGEPSIVKEIERTNAWCDAACERWYGAQRHREPHFASALAAAHRGDKDAAELLSELATDVAKSPALARATALDHLASLGAGVSATGLSKLAEDPHPLVRASAVAALRAKSANQAARALGPLLDDPDRLVRIRTAQALLNTPMVAGDSQPAYAELSRLQQDNFKSALNELHDSLMATNDRAGAHLSWGVMLERSGDYQAAIKAYETASRVEPTAIGPRTNLIALLQQMIDSGRLPPDEVEKLNARIDKLRREDLPLWERDARLAPDLPQVHYQLGQLRYLTGDVEGAVEPLRRAVELSPEEPRYRLFFSLLLQRLQQIPAAIEQAEALLRLEPGVAGYEKLLEELNNERKLP